MFQRLAVRKLDRLLENETGVITWPVILVTHLAPRIDDLALNMVDRLLLSLHRLAEQHRLAIRIPSIPTVFLQMSKGL